MRRRMFLIALTMFVLTLRHAHAQTDVGYLPIEDLPLVETSETEIGFLKSLIGSAQIFFTLSTFGEYWPDYGYSWSDVRDGAGCDSLSAVQSRSKVGSVALVMPKARQSSEYIGLDLTNRISRDTIEDREIPNPITLQRLCAWLSHENPAQIESYVRRAGDLWSMEGSWTPVEIDLNEEYRFVGIGEIVTEAEPDSIGWRLPDDGLLEWEIPQSVDLEMDERQSLHGPLYRLIPTRRWNRLGRSGSAVTFSIWPERDTVYFEQFDVTKWDWDHRDGLEDATIYRLVPSKKTVKPHEIESAWIALRTVDGSFLAQPVESSDTELEPLDTAVGRLGWTWVDINDDGGPIYYLMPTGGSTDRRELQEFTVSVDDHGTVTVDDFPVEEGTTFTLWAADREQSGRDDWWLITEHTLRSPEFTVGIRVTDY